jgi:DNA-binding GntR family transcriptional regulator
MTTADKTNGVIKRGPTVKQQVLELVRRQIVTQERKPGSTISAKGLAKELNVSRTPVREAMEALANEGLIRWSGVEGARIREVDEESLFEILTLRRVLEIEVAVQLSFVLDATRTKALDDLLREMKAALPGAKDAAGLVRFHDLDMKFHHKLPTIAGMGRAEVYVDNLIQHFRLCALRGMSQDTSRCIFEEHTEIVQAIKENDPAAIRATITRHFKKSIERRLPDFQEKAEQRWH